LNKLNKTAKTVENSRFITTAVFCHYFSRWSNTQTHKSSL